LDADRDGERDADEAGFEGVVVALSGSPSGDLLQPTNADGFYLFPDLLPGSYIVRLEPPHGYFPMGGLERAAQVEANVRASVDFPLSAYLSTYLPVVLK
jgi:hypothetical protein